MTNAATIRPGNLTSELAGDHKWSFAMNVNRSLVAAVASTCFWCLDASALQPEQARSIPVSPSPMKQFASDKAFVKDSEQQSGVEGKRTGQRRDTPNDDDNEARIAKARIRAAALKAHIDDFTMTLAFVGQPHRHFLLSVKEVAEMTTTTSKQNAFKVIDALATENLLGRVTTPPPDKLSPGWNMILTEGGNRPTWWRHLGPELNGLAEQAEIRGVRQVLVGDAAVALTRFLTTTNRRLPVQADATFTSSKGLRRSQRAAGVTFSPDGKLVALAHSFWVCVWDASNGKEARIFDCKENEHFLNVRFLRDGKSLAMASNHGLRIWDVGADEMTQRSFSPDTYSNAASTCAISREGIVVISAGRKPHLRHESWQALRSPKVQHAVDVVAIAPDGKRIACGEMQRPTETYPPDYEPA